MNIIGEGVNILLIAVGVLHGDLYQNAVLQALGVNGLGGQQRLLIAMAVQMQHELPQTAVVAEDLLLRLLAALVPEHDANPLVQKGHLLQTAL